MKIKQAAPVVLASSMLAISAWVAAQQLTTPPPASSQSERPAITGTGTTAATGTTGSTGAASPATPPAASTPPAAPGAGPATAAGGGTRSTAAQTGTMSAGDREVWDRRHRASKIIGTDVRNPAGEKIGDIEDIILDDKGNAQVAIVSTGGFLGIGDSLHAVPWSSLQVATGEDNRGDRILNMDKDQLRQVPGFSSKEWPNFADPAWSDKNRGFYNR